MEKYEVLEHTADLKIKVSGRDLVELFINAGLALAEQQKPRFKKQELKKEKWEPVEIQSSDLNSLLVDWLNEILSRSDLNHKVYFNFKIEELSETNLRAKIKGLPTEEKNIDIKAATYHDLEVKQVDNQWQAIVIFDI